MLYLSASAVVIHYERRYIKCMHLYLYYYRQL